MKKLVILGKGPAGISAALYAVRGGADVTVVGKSGGALEKAGLIQNYYGFEDGVDAKQLVAAGVKQAENLGAAVLDGEVSGIGFAADGFEVKLTDGSVLPAGAVIIACGTSRNVPPIGNIRRFEGTGVSYCADRESEENLNAAYSAALIWAGEEQVISRTHTVRNVAEGVIYEVKFSYLHTISINFD